MNASAEVIACSKNITLHCLESKPPIANFTHHRGLVNSVSINHNNKVIASCGQDGKIFLVNAEKPETKLMEHNFYPIFKEKPASLSACAFSPNSKFLAVGSVDSVVKLWDLKSDKNQKDQSISQIKSHLGAISSLAWIKSLKGEGYGTETLASASTSGDIYIHSNKSGEFVQSNYLKMQEGINCIRVSESMDFCRLAACTNGGSLSIWDLMGNKDKPIWSTTSSENKASTTSLSFSPFNSVLLVTSSVDENLVFYDIQERKPVKKIITEQPLSCVGLHQNGHVLVAGGMYGSLFVYDLRYPLKPQNKLIGHDTTIKHLQFYKPKERELGENKMNRATSSTSSMHSNQLQKNSVVQTSQQDPKLKETPKMTEVVINNFINIQKPQQLEEKAKESVLDSKLPRSTQQIIKSSIPKKQEIVSQFKQSADSDFYRNRSKQAREPFPHSSPNDYQSLKKDLKEMKQTVTTLKSGQQQIKNDMYDLQQRLTLSMIKQFQLHQQQMTSLIQSMLSKNDEKDKLIKKLEEENKKLKTTTF